MALATRGAGASAGELAAVSPGGELGAQGLANAHEVESFAQHDEPDVGGLGAEGVVAEAAFAGFDGFPAFFERG